MMQKRHVGISAFLCVFVSVCTYLIGFKVLVAKLDEMFQWAVVVDLLGVGLLLYGASVLFSRAESWRKTS